MAIARRRLALEEFMKRPERKPALEFMDARVTQKVAPNVWHSGLRFWLAGWFNAYCEPRKLGLAFPELRTTFSGASPVPDVSVIAWQRLPRDATGGLLMDFHQSPDIAVEITSPGRWLNAMRERCRWYADHGVPLTLLVDPQRESVLLFVAHAEERLLRGRDVIE